MSSAVPYETIVNFRADHRLDGNMIQIFVEGFNLESGRAIRGVELQKKDSVFYLIVKSGLVSPLEKRPADFSELRREWGSDLKKRVSFAKEFELTELPKGAYQLKYGTFDNTAAPVIYQFSVE